MQTSQCIAVIRENDYALCTTEASEVLLLPLKSNAIADALYRTRRRPCNIALFIGLG